MRIVPRSVALWRVNIASQVCLFILLFFVFSFSFFLLFVFTRILFDLHGSRKGGKVAVAHMLRVKIAGFAAGSLTTLALYYQLICLRVIDIHAAHSKRLQTMGQDLLRASCEVSQLLHAKGGGFV
ncbi:hypothetical protein TcCL_ESM08355 [Trypanosoma cruzi]|nr:hypothetical protein TcCL_ESM08355 [Trypanosoma cruzi]